VSLRGEDWGVEIKYSEKAAKQIERIHRGDKKSAFNIIERIEAYSKNPRGHFDLKLLKGRYGNFKRIRAGEYRIIFEDNGEVMLIYEIKHRQEAYHD
jgi:mRNA-degrading endonuclease RelE of RelBE toxin-antitoxin system